MIFSLFIFYLLFSCIDNILKVLTVFLGRWLCFYDASINLQYIGVDLWNCRKRRFLVNQQRSKSDDSVIYANVAPCIRGNNVTMNMNTLTPHTYAIPQIVPNTVGDKCLQKGNGGYDKIHYIYVEW
mgnify:CR=1 FL=1